MEPSYDLCRDRVRAVKMMLVLAVFTASHPSDRVVCDHQIDQEVAEINCVSDTFAIS
jgi:hypothetical protein